MRAGAGRPAGARDRRTLQSHADVAAVIARMPVRQLVLLSPEDVLRLAMLLAVRRGDLAALDGGSAGRRGAGRLAFGGDRQPAGRGAV